MIDYATKFQTAQATLGLEPLLIERAAKAIYYSGWCELPTGKFPPTWEATSEEIRNFTRLKALNAVAITVAIIRGYDLASLNLGPARSG